MVAIPSRLLYDTMDAHGHTLDLSTFTCPSCRGAIDADGSCDEHRIGFVRKQAYYSRLTTIWRAARAAIRRRSRVPSAAGT
jgi:hypothetical protein